MAVMPHRTHHGHRCRLLLQMSHIAWFVCLFVYVSVLSCAKTAEPIEMLIGF